MTIDTRESFTLLLNSEKLISQGGFVLNSDTNANVKYQVNFDELFQQRDKLYKYAQIRAQLISERVSVSPLPSSIGTISIVGLGMGDSKGTDGLPILFSLNIGSPIASGDATTGYFATSFGASLGNSERGIQFTSIPFGIREFSVQFTSTTGAIQAGGNIGNYNLLIQFELYN